jgi:hypothetical protein
MAAACVSRDLVQENALAVNQGIGLKLMECGGRSMRPARPQGGQQQKTRSKII